MPEPIDLNAYYHELAAGLIDAILDLLEQSAAAGVEIDPLALIMERLQARGETMDLSDAPPMMRMLLSGLSG